MTEAASKSPKSALGIVYLTVFIDLLGFGIILPTLPYYARAFGASGAGVGVLMMAYSVAQFIGAPILGRLSDRYGRRPILLGALVGSTVSLALQGLSSSLGLMIFARTIAGLFGGSISAAQAYVADVTEPDERAKYMGLLGASIGMGFVFGPAIGAGLAPYGFGASAFVASGLAFLNFIAALIRLPEPARKTIGAQHLSLGPLFIALRSPALRNILVVNFIVTVAFVAMETTFALLGADRFSLTARDLGGVFTLLGVVIVIVQGGLVGRLAKKLGELKLVVIGVLVMALGLVLVPTTHELAISVLGLAVLAFGQALATPSLSTLLSRRATAAEQGSVLGSGQAMSALARAVGPLLAGGLYDRSVVLPYGVGAILCVCAALLMSRDS
jgi:DHA1 family tetracycline resistance protein-like MFS transporter